MGGRREDEYSVLRGKPERKRLLGKCRHRWEDNIKNDYNAIKWEAVDCSSLAEGPVAGCCGHRDVYLAVIKCRDIVDYFKNY